MSLCSQGQPQTSFLSVFQRVYYYQSINLFPGLFSNFLSFDVVVTNPISILQIVVWLLSINFAPLDKSLSPSLMFWLHKPSLEDDWFSLCFVIIFKLPMVNFVIIMIMWSRFNLNTSYWIQMVKCLSSI